MSTKKPHLAEKFHFEYLAMIRREIEPVRVLSRVIVKKLNDQGIDGAKHIESIERSVAKTIASPPSNMDSNFVLNIDDGNLETTIAIKLEDADLDKAVSGMTDVVVGASAEIFTEFGEIVLKDVLSDPARRLLHQTNERDAFGRRLELTWAKAFQLLDIHVSVCCEIGEARNEWLRKKRKRSKDIVVVDVITRLHGRAIAISGEVQVLLRNGFADGALSRWRTIHELVVTAMFIAEHGSDVAERYISHVDADSIKAARQYQKFAPVLGYRPISQREQRRLDARSLELVATYGKSFLSDYGWASDALQNPKPTFANIEEAVDLDKLRPYVRLASNTVHAGAKGTFFRLGLLGDQDIILAGASNVGLEEAGRLVALSLAQITTVLLNLHANTDSIVWSRVLHTLSLKVEQQFHKVKRRIEREEREMRNA
jgi:hypothetical protein